MVLASAERFHGIIEMFSKYKGKVYKSQIKFIFFHFKTIVSSGSPGIFFLIFVFIPLGRVVLRSFLAS